MKTTAIRLAAASMAAVLSSCVDTSPSSGFTPSPMEQGDAVDHVLTRTLAMESTAPSGDVSKISVPVLRSTESRTGKPVYRIMDDGSYIATYRWSSRYLQIVGTPRGSTPPSYPPEGILPLMGKIYPTDGTGNEDPEFTSRAVTLTAPDGRTANYVIIYGGNRDVVTQDQLYRTVPRIGW